MRTLKQIKQEDGVGGLKAMARDGKWVYCGDVLPPDDMDVETKIDDARGVRNVCVLRRHSNLWWFPDMSMYIYYSPTHWRKVTPPSADDLREREG